MIVFTKKTILKFNLYLLLNFLVFPAAFAQVNFVAWGDFGTGSEKQKRVAKDIIAYCQNKTCQFAVTTGDNIYDHGIDNKLDGNVDFENGSPDFQTVKKRFSDIYEELNIPIYMTLGNHDIGNTKNIDHRMQARIRNQITFSNHSYNPVVLNSRNKESRLWYFPAPFYYEKEKHNIHLWSLNTNTYPNKFPDLMAEIKDYSHLSQLEGSAQKKWLENTLQEKSGWKIVTGHMPLYSHGRHGKKDAKKIEKFRNSIIETLCENKVDFYLSGHDHHLEIDKHECENGHLISAVLTGAGAKDDVIHRTTFPLLGKDKNLLWANGKHYTNTSLSFWKTHKVLGFTAIELKNDKTAKIKMILSDGAISGYTNGCFIVKKGKSISKTDCKD